MIEEFMRLSLVGKLGVDHQDEALSLIQSPRIEPNPGAIEILARIENVQNSKAHIWMLGLIAALLIFLTFEWISYKINMDKTMQEERYSVLEKELSSANAKISDLSTNQVDQIVQIQELTTEKNNLENDKLTLQTNLTQCKCQMSKLLDKNNALIIKEQMMIKEHSTKLNEAVDKLKKSHRNQLEEKNETIKRLETNLNKLRQYQDECDRLRLQLKQVEKERDFTASQLKELTIIKSKIDQEKRELREKIKEEEKLLSINSKIQQKIEDLNNLLEIKSIEHETCLKNLEMQSQKITILTVEMEKNKLAFEHQINELSATKETILEELNLSCEISELQQALDLSQTQIEERNDKIAELEKEVEKKESELDRVYDLYSKVEQDYIDLKHLHSLCKQEQHKNDPNEINVTTTESHCQSTAELSEALTMSQTLMDVTPSGSLHEKEHSPSASNQHQNNESQRNSKKKKKKNLASKTTSVTSSPQQDSPPKQEKVETTKNHSNNTPTNESTQSELVSSVHLQPIDPSSSTSSEEQLLRASNKMKKRKVQHHSVKKQLFVKTTKQ
ncbi:hypothetical protein FDP41_011303 [Naegleria fowleri]|uniref:Uncharacterized protein n=1 Tax=Naegleria fowleri TaxID=5763 RepID=A0A6A5BWB0_NAEFO|nr:uncharacterized protein FDP41_011303 [Naegleria fowleri]KAF0982373.1 hypothetical protein FDP41_011303 [Naegleria fowleri]